MSARRTGFWLLSIVAVSSLVIANDDPFARWDRTRQAATQPAKPVREAVAQNPVARPVANPKASASLAYFSPTSEEHQTTIEEVAARVQVERLQVEPSPASTPETAVSQTTVPPRPDRTSPSPAAGQVTLAVQHPTANTATQAAEDPFASGIFNASFEDAPESQPAIQQTGAQFETAPDESFEDFIQLQKSNEARAIPAVTVSQPSPEFRVPPASEVEFSEPFDAAAGKMRFPKPSARVDVAPSTEQTVGPQTPSVTIRWDHHGEFNVGQQCRSDLIVENSGTTLVGNVAVEAVVPQGLDVVNAVPPPTASGDTATWNIGKLKPGQKRRIELTLVPGRQGDVTLNAYVRMTGASTTSLSIREPKVALQLDGPQTLEVGQLVHYTVNVSNPGTGTARNVLIQTVVPEGLEHKRGKMLTIDIGTLSPGESRKARLSLTGIKGGDQKLAVRVIADGGLNEQSIETVAVAEPRLNIGVRGPAECVASQPNSYEVIVVNEGNVDSNNVRAKYRVPTGFDFVKADRGGKFNETDRTIDWFVGTLEPGQLKHFTVSLRPTDAGPAKHQVGVISEHGKMTMAEHATTVQGSAKLALSVRSSAARVSSSGGESSLEIRVTNTGQTTAESVGLSCEVPPGLNLVEISGPSEYIADSGAIIFRALPKLAAGESALFVIRTKCNRSGEHVARARVASRSIPQALIDQTIVSGSR